MVGTVSTGLPAAGLGGLVLLVCAVASLVAALLAAVFLTDAEGTEELVHASADARQ